jgi:uncharacterized protein (UPF0548 family)
MRFVRPSDFTSLEQMAADLMSAEPTYGDVGGTLAGTRPDGFHYDHCETLLGQGPDTFQRAVAGLKSWKAHRLPGMSVFPRSRRSSAVRPLSSPSGRPLWLSRYLAGS